MLNSKSQVPKKKRKAPRTAFKKGHKFATGNPHAQRIKAYTEVLKRNVTDEDCAAVWKKLLRLAKSGDMDAIREFNNRTVGKARVLSPELRGMVLPELVDPKSTVTAADALLKAVAAGQLQPDDAMKLSGIIELARRTLETELLLNRIEKLEREVVARDS
jgi:hypothetical protein